MLYKDICKVVRNGHHHRGCFVFCVNKGDKVEGPNGAENHIVSYNCRRENEPTSGDVFIRSGYVVGYLQTEVIYFSQKRNRLPGSREDALTHSYEMKRRFFREGTLTQNVTEI